MKRAVRMIGAGYLALFLICTAQSGLVSRQFHLAIPMSVLAFWFLPPAICLAASYTFISRGRFWAAALSFAVGSCLLFCPCIKVGTCGTCVISVSYGW
jgi:hypothetical protein